MKQKPPAAPRQSRDSTPLSARTSATIGRTVIAILHRDSEEFSLSELKRTELSVRQEKAILVGVILPGSTADPRDPLGELASLIKTAGAKVAGTVLQRRHKVDAGTYVGSGKALEIANLAKEKNANVVVFDNDLSPGQIGALEKLINEEAGSRRNEGIKVLDRSELILDIFATRAQTHEARLQVELAQMEYTYPRLARMWGHLERITGSGAGMGIGTRGPGETQLETDRRMVRKRISDLKADIQKVQDRKSRMVAQRNRENFTVCIVGYTNAGKSTLFNTLTAAGAYADDKLFATLDTKTRAWRIERARRSFYPTPWVSYATCHTTLSPRSRPRLKKPSTPIFSFTCLTLAIPTPNSSSDPFMKS